MAKYPFLKFSMLRFLAQSKEASGYDFIRYCKEKGIPASAGTVYPQLRKLMEDGILTMRVDRKNSRRERRIYSLTEEGKKFVDEIEKNKEGMKSILNRLGVVMGKGLDTIPPMINKIMRPIFYQLHSIDWKDRNDVRKLLKNLEKLEEELRRWIDEE